MKLIAANKINKIIQLVHVKLENGVLNYAPINSKLQHPSPPPPPGIPRAFDCASCPGRGGGNLNVALEGFSVFAGSDGFTRSNFVFVSE